VGSLDHEAHRAELVNPDREHRCAMGARVLAWLRRVLPLAGIAFFALALWLLHEELPADSYGDLVDALGALPRVRLAAALVFTVVGYAVLTGYDLLALRHIDERVPLRDAAGAAMLSGALGNNLGNTLLTGSAVRFWLYIAVGLAAQQITRLVLLCSLGFWLGYLFLGAFFFLTAPPAARKPQVTTPPGVPATCDAPHLRYSFGLSMGTTTNAGVGADGAANNKQDSTRTRRARTLSVCGRCLCRYIVMVL
jgi:hypothetical protein